MNIAQVRLESVTGEPVGVDGQVALTVDRIGGHSFLVLRDIKGDGIIGSDFLTARGVTVNYDKGQLRLGQKCMPLFQQGTEYVIPPLGAMRDTQGRHVEAALMHPCQGLGPTLPRNSSKGCMVFRPYEIHQVYVYLILISINTAPQVSPPPLFGWL